MPHPVSTVERLPPEVREALDEWLRDPSISLPEATRRANDRLQELGSTLRLSRNSLYRYDLRMRRAAEKLRQSREVAEAWIDKIGSAPDGKLGHLLIEMLRTLAFDLTTHLQEGDLDDKSLAGLVQAATSISLMARRLEESSDMIDRRERRIKREAAKEAAAKAAKKQDPGGAVSLEQVRQVIRDIYGVS